MRRLILSILMLLGAGTLIYMLLRPAPGQAAFGPALALCPGPDLYGYTCDRGAAFAYIDATQDTGLFADDSVVEITLPFAFTFYGTTYRNIFASSNGNLQFNEQNPAYENVCLLEGPAPGMGDMIAPYWDDLDPRFIGHVETETVGESPDRIFVIEWDGIPPYNAADDDRVTFAVQLFEGSNDIVFLYDDVVSMNGSNGRSATIGLQSESQGLALQYGCNQASVADAERLHIQHPEEANETVGLEAVRPASASPPLSAKGDVQTLLLRFNQLGRQALPSLRSQWLTQPRARSFTWRWADVTGDGQSDLVALWRGPVQRPESSSLAVLAADEGGELRFFYDHSLSQRAWSMARPEILEIVDVTGDGILDVVLQAQNGGLMAVFSIATGEPLVHNLPDVCHGPLAIRDVDGNGTTDIVRGNCENDRRAIFTWEQGDFKQSP